MKEEEIKEYIEKNKNSLPLSFNELTYRTHDGHKVLSKSLDSEKYRDGNFNIIKFYKPITRFK